MMADIAESVVYKAKDFKSDQEVRWCPGCGDYAILSAIQKAMPLIERKPEDIVFISGIGCSSRFPYYMNTYGFHTIHGRAPAIASGVKLANPDLSVWQITGDGDALAIGGNHFIHAIRRNIDINIILFNNEIYGLTKGQYSPTSNVGLTTKSSPMGSLDMPFNPGSIVMGARGSFFARVADTNPKHMTKIFVESEKHRGTSVIEVLQNCVIFNDAVFEQYTAKDVRSERQLILEHGEPMLFGAEKNKGIVLEGLKLKAIEIDKDGYTLDDVLVHDMYEMDNTLHSLLIQMDSEDLPIAMGIIRCVETTTYNEQIMDQLVQAKEKGKYTSLDELFESGETWEVG